MNYSPGGHVLKGQKPLVLCFSGLDATGGAGIQADIETLLTLGCHALPLINSLTVQTTRNVLATHPSEPDLLRRQFDALQQSQLVISAIKIGLIDSISVMRCISDIVRAHPSVPVIADPVIKAGGGFEFADDSLVQAYQEYILPYCDVLTPNTHELNKLCPGDGTEDEALRTLCEQGCKYILLTGTHRDSAQVINRLYSIASPDSNREWTWPRLPGEYHGSGCTLASAMAAGLAKGMSHIAAADAAQHFTWYALKNALQAGDGQFLPDRRLHDRSGTPQDASVC